MAAASATTLNPFRQAFSDPVTLLVVVHAETSKQAVRNANRAFTSGADGTFLINHRISEIELIGCYRAVRKQQPASWVGLSFIGLSAPTAFANIPRSASGLWVGDAGVHEVDGPSAEAEAFLAQRVADDWPGVYFGGVAFKHQRLVTDVRAAASAAAPCVDVVTTSGVATGRAAPLEKVAAMKSALGHHPLALASGITDENASSFAGIVDAVLVATGVSDSEAELNSRQIARLARRLKGLQS